MRPLTPFGIASRIGSGPCSSSSFTTLHPGPSDVGCAFQLECRPLLSSDKCTSRVWTTAPTMRPPPRLRGLTFTLFVLLVVATVSVSARPSSDSPHACSPSSDDDERCQELDRITSLETGVQSLVRLPCLGCSWIRAGSEDEWEDKDEDDRRAGDVGTDLVCQL